MAKTHLRPQIREDMEQLVRQFIQKHERVATVQRDLDNKVAALYKSACSSVSADMEILQAIVDSIEAGISLFPELESGEKRSVAFKSGTLQLRHVTALEVENDAALIDELDTLLADMGVSATIKRKIRACIATKRSIKKKELLDAPDILEHVSSASRVEYDSISIAPAGTKKNISATVAPLRINLIE